jgi:ubiquinone/menaquinone biosynthesis C-methylase UbiE
VREFFDAQAPRWSRGYAAGGNMASRVARFKAAVRACEPSDAAVLDYGCGTGEIAAALAAEGYRVTAADISPEMLAVARQLATDVSTVLLDHASSCLPFADAAFDVVVSSSVLEYVSDPVQLLQEFRRILKPDGRLIVTVPDPDHPVRGREAVFRRIGALPVIRRVVARSPLRAYARYLQLSINRFPTSHWLELMTACGFAAHLVDSEPDPLALITATRTQHASPS